MPRDDADDHLTDEEFTRLWNSGARAEDISSQWGNRDASMVSRRAKKLGLPPRGAGGTVLDDMAIVVAFSRVLAAAPERAEEIIAAARTLSGLTKPAT